MAAPPPVPERPPRPLGDLDAAPATDLVELAVAKLGGPAPSTRHKVRVSMREFLAFLAEFPGDTWQKRWDAADLNQPGRPVGEVADREELHQRRLNRGAGEAFAMRLIQPTLLAFRSYQFFYYARWFRAIAQDSLLEECCERIWQRPLSRGRLNTAVAEVCCALTVFGIDLRDLTPEALLYFSLQGRQHGVTMGSVPAHGAFGGTVLWPVLHEMGIFPKMAPTTLRGAITVGQRPIADLVDDHQLTNTPVRNLLVDYLTRRSVTMDYNSLQHLTSYLVPLFWKIIEEINPDQTDLRLDDEVVHAWRTRIATRPDGHPRQQLDAVLLGVRSLYLDLHSWAAAEPERWAHWVAPCPVRDDEFRAANRRRRRQKERIAARTRERQPLIPVLSAAVTDRWHELRTLLEAAQAVNLGKPFVHAGVQYQRTTSNHEIERNTRRNPPVRVINRDTGQLIRLTHDENQAFWEWAVIETLRLSGVRVEELSELTHLSVRNYQRPNGEVVALLVIAPSKSDHERVIPMSAELFHVIAQVIRRHLRNHGTVPIAARYDLHEKVWQDPLPYLFQGMFGAAHRAFSTSTLWKIIRRAVDRIVPAHPEFQGLQLSPHDLRRHFATELVNGGLPIHIGAALLGHVDIQTTRGYVAVFEEQIVARYQEFLDRRRAQRPETEYQPVDDDEWSEFQQHFGRRRVELGTCGRPYGTPCQHEHACLRCPMLSVDPRMLERLDELETDLMVRRKRANEENWLGEVEGIDLTLTFLRSKRQQAHRTIQSGTPGHTDLGMPALRREG